MLRSSQTLTGPHSPHPRILERRQDPVEYPRGPGNVVISEDGDFRLDFRYSSSHLAPLIGLCYTEDADARRLHTFDHFPRTFDMCIDGHQQYLERLGAEQGLNGLPQLSAVPVNGRDDDGDVLGSQRGVLWYRNRSKRPEGKQIDD